MKNGYLEEAEKVSAIIQKGISKKKYETIYQNLKEIGNTDKVEYVFDYNESFNIRIIFLMIFFIVLFVAILFLGFGILKYSNNTALAYTFIVVSISFLLIDCVVIWNQILQRLKSRRFLERYRMYKNILRVNNVILLDDLAAFSRLKKDQIIKDLKKAIKLKLIPQGHFTTDYLVFMVNNSSFNKYQNNRVYYDQYYAKQIEERNMFGERTPEMQDVIDYGKSYVEKIREWNNNIPNKEISEKLDCMEKIVDLIFYEVDVNPTHIKDLHLFLKYYLPTTEKLLEAYIKTNKSSIHSESLTKMRSDIVNSLDTINQSFEDILEKFYEEKQLDISSDIFAMKYMMGQ